MKVPPPVYDARLVAEAILYSCENKVRELTVGAGGGAMAAFLNAVPALSEPLAAVGVPLLYKSKAQRSLENSLHSAGADGAERSPRYRFVLKHSPFTKLQMHPTTVMGAGAAVGALLGLLAAGKKADKRLKRRDRRSPVVYAVPPGAWPRERSGGASGRLLLLAAAAGLAGLAWKERDRLKAIRPQDLKSAATRLKDRATRLGDEKGAYWSKKGAKADGRAAAFTEARELRDLP